MNVTTSVALALFCSGLVHDGAPLEARVLGTASQAAQTCRRDQSGVAWTLPFGEALARAKAEQRLLFIKPIAFGTSPDGGW